MVLRNETVPAPSFPLQMQPEKDSLRRFAADLEAAAGRERMERLATRAMGRAQTASHRSLRWALASTVMLAMMVGLTGTVADDATPGELLYPVDRAAERVGIGRGSAAERLREALVAAQAGDTDRARLVAAEAVTQIRPDLRPVPATVGPGGTEAPDVADVIVLAVEAVLRSLDDPAADVEGALDGLVMAIEGPGTTTSTTTTSTTTTTTGEPVDTTETTGGSGGPPSEGTTTTTGGIILPPMP